MKRDTLDLLSTIITMFAVLYTASCAGPQPADEAMLNKKTSPGNEAPGFAVIGDSNSDEYHADDQRGGDYSETTFNWVEILARSREINFGAWGAWSEPRRNGFEFNWARSGADTKDLLTSGQHRGVAQKVVDGQVSYVLIWIGANDFSTTNGQYQAIYDGSVSDKDLREKTTRIIAQLASALDEIYQAGGVKVLVITYRDPGATPVVAQMFPDVNGRKRASDAIQAVNARLARLATERGFYLVDSDAALLQLLVGMDEQGYIVFGGERINVLEKGDEPHHLLLGDHAGHPGTVLSGMIANELFIKPLNSAYGTQIAPLSESEILKLAGLRQNGSAPQKTFTSFELFPIPWR
jgi:hypothetical protein